jgi:hypothetical protein
MLTDLTATHQSFMYLERYVNEGSPSGFTALNTPGEGFRPSDPVEHFSLPIFQCAPLGGINVGTPCLAVGELPVHPEMQDAFIRVSGQRPHRHVTAAPTSSGRTLAITADSMCFYVKVAYQRLLGRVTRRMTRSHVLSSIEVSALYESAIEAQVLPPSLHIYRERSGLYFPDASLLCDWGYVERDLTPYPHRACIQVPAFALLAGARQGSSPLFNELLSAVPSLCTASGAFTGLVQPILDAYFSSVTTLGLQPEAHAQNVVFLLDESYSPVGIALRDMESVDKDLPLLEACNYADRFTPTDYKFLSKSAYNYQIMHSFMFDFKLGQYLLAPLVDAWAVHTQSPPALLEALIRPYARSKIAALPPDFFPEGVWYDYEPVVHEGTPTRTYTLHHSPRFR